MMARLQVSFWHVELDNLPEGRFVHRSLSADEARRVVAEARRADGLECASRVDLFAPYHERERGQYEALCRILHDDFGMALSFSDFVFDDEVDGEKCETIRPLAFVFVSEDAPLLVVDANFTLADKREPEGDLRFDLAADSVCFHLFELCD